MSAAFLLLPFPAVWFGLLAALNWGALRRGPFCPAAGRQRAALIVYQAPNAAIFLGLSFSFRCWGWAGGF